MLTGVTRHRTSWRGKLILQVEYEFPHQGHFRWRDATERDVFELKKIRNSQTKGWPYIPQSGYNPKTGKQRGYKCL